ncbi:EAL domain-containing protein [Christensenellaceae bacterium OttesenSCG-928-K19]|nr:EAL domain-containing protein [Christensenellaceae bacterium OttesenSCG-928-K19]
MEKYSENLIETRMLLDEINAGVLALDKITGEILFCNEHVCAALGKERDYILGKSYKQIFRPEFIPVYERLLIECENGIENSTVYYWPEKNVWEQVSVKETEYNATSCILLTITDVSDIVRTRYKHDNLVYFDPVLHLPNGEKLEQDINELANLETVSLLFITLEQLTELYNLYGWENGDQLLISIRDWLLESETRRAQLYVIDRGFAILGRNVDMGDIKARAKEILTRFNRPWEICSDGHVISVFCPVKAGVIHGKYIKNEMRNILLRTSWMVPKYEGFAVYDEETDGHIRRMIALRAWLVQCVNTGMQGFDVYYQPIIKLDNMKWSAVEALCRWTAPDGEAVSPIEFIHLAEQLGLIEQIDSWVRKRAMRDCVKLGLDQKDFFLSVNFSPTHKVNEKFMHGLMRNLLETGFPAKKLNLEITESAKMSFEEEDLRALKKLEDAGVMLCLDDFGTGYSSISNLVNISAQILKTEKKFIDGMVGNDYKQYLLRVLADLAAHLGMSLIVEGVETEAQLELIQGFNIDYAQGYYFSRPVPFEQLAAKTGNFSL